MTSSKHREKSMNLGYEKPEVVENYANRFQGKRFSHTHTCEVKSIERFFEIIGPINSVIDIPCGAGRFQKTLSKYTYKITQVDYSSQMLCKAEENMSDYLPQVFHKANFVRASIFDLPFNNNTFDVVLAMRIYHHFDCEEERIEILRELRRISKNWIIISFFNARCYQQIRRRLKKKLGKKCHRYAITIQQFKKELSTASLELVKLYSNARFISHQTVALVKIKD